MSNATVFMDTGIAVDSGWSNFQNAANDSTSSYAESPYMATTGTDKWVAFSIKSQSINAAVPSNSTINSVKIVMVSRTSSGGTYNVLQYYPKGGYSYEYRTSITESDPVSYNIDDRTGIGSSWTTSEWTLSHVSEIRNGITWKINCENRRFAGNRIQIATAKVVIDYTENFTATFTNYDGTVLQNSAFPRGTVPSYTGATPTKPSTAQYSYTFAGWEPAPASITSNTTYVAQYTAAIRAYSISTAVSPSGTGIVNGAGTYNYGAQVTLIAIPASGYRFDRWSDGNTNATRTVTVTGSASYTAEFIREHDSPIISAVQIQPNPSQTNGNYIITVTVN